MNKDTPNSESKNWMQLTEDGMRLRLHLDGEFTAAGLQDLVLRLGSVRKEMLPPVPRTQQDNGGAQIACTTEALSEFAADHADQEGTQVLRFRSERFGWLGWALSNAHAKALFEHLGVQLGLLQVDRRDGSTGNPKH